MSTPPRLRLFVSSPGDVELERTRARKVLERLKNEFRGRIEVVDFFWESENLDFAKSFQANLPNTADFDVVVCFLWSRLGSPLHSSLRLPDGSPARSGTEYELEHALASQRQRNEPKIFVWRNLTQPSTSLEPPEEAEKKRAQYAALKAYLERSTLDKDGTFKGSYSTYTTLEGFEELFEVKLRKLLEAVALPATGPVRPPRTWQGESPYLGLRAFEFEHAPIFFGRTRAVGAAIACLRASLTHGSDPRAFLLIAGASGSGKSSLARAGIIPDLVTPGVIDGVGLWRRAILKPSDAAGDPMTALAAALLSETAFPGLGEHDTPAALAQRLASHPEVVVEAIRGLLRQAASEHRLVQARELEALQRTRTAEGRHEDARIRAERLANLKAPQARLVLLVDQCEELFTSATAPDRRERFIAALAALARADRGSLAFVLVTLRSDFYPRLVELPLLLELSRESGTLHLGPPNDAELGQMIRFPAQAAGVVFEDHREHGRLDEVIRAEAATEGASLPLLEYALDELYRVGASDGELSHAEYQALGGLHGAVMKRAEATFLALSIEGQQAFDSVLRLLVTLGEGEGLLPARKTLYPADTPLTPAARTLVDALTSARLLTAHTDEETGRETISLAHEALLRTWPRLVAWIQSNHDFLRKRADLDRRLEDYRSHGGSADLLLQGLPLAEAEDLLAHHADALDPAEQDFVRASRKKSDEEARRRRNIRRTLVGLVTVSLLITLGFLWRLDGEVKKKQAAAAEAQANAKRADAEAETAKTKSKEALENAARADREAKAAIAAKEDVLRLSALQTLEDLIAKAATLWPAHPENLQAYADWMKEADALVADLPTHRETLAKIRERALPLSEEERRRLRESHELDSEISTRPDWTFANDEDRWWHNQIAKLVEELEEFSDDETGLDSLGISPEHGWGIPKRAEFARTIAERSIEGPEASARWREASAAIAKSQEYGGLELRPQLGLLPIGADPASGLWEFAHLQTGDVPARDAVGRLVLAEEMGLVFVLLPGGKFWMGAQADDQEGQNYDPQAASDEDLHKVTLSPFFLSKYEMTQGQWVRFTGGNPSYYKDRSAKTEISLLHPVEQVSWSASQEVLRCLGLQLPSEARWEYGCRAGTGSIWSQGSRLQDLNGKMNIADEGSKDAYSAGWVFEPGFSDGWDVHCPAGSLPPNQFGLHETHGNVWEWCFDGYDNSFYRRENGVDPVSPPAGSAARVSRGGSFNLVAVNARSASRSFFTPSDADSSLGLRPARTITP